VLQFVQFLSHRVIFGVWLRCTVHFHQLLNLLLELIHLSVLGALLQEELLICQLLVLKGGESLLEHADLPQDLIVHLVSLGLLLFESL